jgi:acetyl esterase/lipase|tara:strand:+ start:269 stop:1189 length:921 start_codon:yes stop_codon:yes gene_type:complete
MSSEESKIVFKHQENLVKTFFSITDESIGMKHFRYTNDDYFSADESIKSCGKSFPIVADGIYAQWVTTENSDPNKRILYLHGGGYAIGTIRGYLALSSQLAKATDCSVLVIDYSLAPENKFPAAINDSMKAFNWMLENGPNGNTRCDKSFISGDSAGGGLAIGVTLALKDNNLDLPNAVIPLSPWAELDPVSESYRTNEKLDPYISKDAIAAFKDLYINDELDVKNPYASPVYGDFNGFPPMLIQVGGREVLIDDSKKIAEKAKEAGCNVSLEIWDDMVHVFHGYAPFLPEANEALEVIGKFIADK